MMKWLRKYNRRLLAVVTALILVSWLIGTPLQNLLSPDESRTAIGTAFGTTIRARDLYPASTTTLLLEALGIDWRRPAGIPSKHAQPLRTEHWYLLVEESRASGIEVPERDIDRFFQMQGYSAPLLDSLRRTHQVSLTQIREAIRDYLRVQYLAALAGAVNSPSERQIRHYVRDTQDRLIARVAVFRARSFVDAKEPVKAEEAQAQFDRYKDGFPGESDVGYGYKWPRRVRVEYLGARVSDLLPHIQVAEDDIRRYYRQNRDAPEFMKREVRPPTTAPTSGPTTTAATQPEVVTRAMTFTEARAQIETTLKRRAATARIRDAMEQIATELARPWIGVPAGADGYKPAPNEVRDPGYLSAAKERYEKRFNVPLFFRQTDLLAQELLVREAGIGAASTAGEGGDQLSFPQYAFRVPGFFDASKASETAPRLSLFQTPDTPIYNTSFGQPYDHYVFRVVEARQAEVPGTLDEVRERVENDVREEHGYAAAERRAREFFASARHVGVDEAYRAASDLQDPRYQGEFAPQPTAPIARRESMQDFDREGFLKSVLAGGKVLQAPYVGAIGARSEEFADRCFEMASPMWVPPAVEAPPTTRPVATAPTSGPSAAVNFIPLPRLRMCAVAELKDVRPVREDDYESRARGEARDRLSMTRRLALRAGWFNPKSVEERCGFVRAKTVEGREVEARPIRPRQPQGGGYY